LDCPCGWHFFALSKQKTLACARRQPSRFPILLVCPAAIIYNGTVVFEAEAAPDKPLTVKADLAAAGCKFVALDRSGAEIGSVSDQGDVKLFEPKIPAETAAKPKVETAVYRAPQDETAIRQFLETRDFTVYCDWNATEAEKGAARRMARTLGVGLTWTMPSGKVLAFGNPLTSAFLRDAGRVKKSIAADWPGAGKGAILSYDNLELTQRPVLLVCGSDAEGVVAAAKVFEGQFLKEVQTPKGYAFRPAGVADKIQPHTPANRAASNTLAVTAAKGEYESAQAVITAFEDLHNVEVTVSPLVHAETGKPIDAKYLTKYRQRSGPVWVRWVNYYPLDPAGGWKGYPDPLLERPETDIAAGRSQALWLTFIVSENAAAGLYKATLTCKANGVEQSIPIEVNVWDFVIPRTGLLGDPYITLGQYPPDDRREMNERMLRAYIENLVEHGMRVIHLSEGDLFRLHFSPTAEYKGLNLDWLVTSDDGAIALDTSRFDDLVRQIDDAAKPFDVRYMVYMGHVVSHVGPQKEFKTVFPKRFADRPKREGSENAQGYYAEELLGLYKRHLERRGWLKRFVLKIADEPASFDSWWTNSTVAARNVGLPIMTAFNQFSGAEAEKGIGAIGEWQVLYMLHDEAFFRKAKAAGDLVGWYNCGPPPKTAVHASASELRGYLWQAAKADLDVISWWGIQCWKDHHAVWYDRYMHWNSVIYPAHPQKGAWQKAGKSWVDAAPIDSIRWELIREGMEDAAYVMRLRQDIAAARQKGRTAEADRAQAVLDGVWKDVFPTLNDYAPPYPRIEESRHKLAEAIVVLQAK
jgi:hypothetical protein